MIDELILHKKRDRNCFNVLIVMIDELILHKKRDSNCFNVLIVMRKDLIPSNMFYLLIFVENIYLNKKNGSYRCHKQKWCVLFLTSIKPVMRPAWDCVRLWRLTSLNRGSDFKHRNYEKNSKLFYLHTTAPY